MAESQKYLIRAKSQPVLYRSKGGLNTVHVDCAMQFDSIAEISNYKKEMDELGEDTRDWKVSLYTWSVFPIENPI